MDGLVAIGNMERGKGGKVWEVGEEKEEEGGVREGGGREGEERRIFARRTVCDMSSHLLKRSCDRASGKILLG